MAGKHVGKPGATAPGRRPDMPKTSGETLLTGRSPVTWHVYALVLAFWVFSEALLWFSGDHHIFDLVFIPSSVSLVIALGFYCYSLWRWSITSDYLDTGRLRWRLGYFHRRIRLEDVARVDLVVLPDEVTRQPYFRWHNALHRAVAASEFSEWEGHLMPNYRAAIVVTPKPPRNRQRYLLGFVDPQRAREAAELLWQITGTGPVVEQGRL